MDFAPMKAFMQHMLDLKIPGNAVSVWKDGKEVFSHTAGYADRETKEPMTADHLINVYSCTKVATVVTALHLYEEGLFRLDTPVSEFLPEWADLTVRTDHGIEQAKETMTLHHLFTMTSGLNYNVDIPAYKGEKTDTRSVIRELAKEPLDFEPGAKWQYSLSHDVLACVAEVATGKRFADLVKEQIFVPCGMENSHFHNEGLSMAKQYRMVTPNLGDLVDAQAYGHEILHPDTYVELTDGSNWLVPGPDYDSGGAGMVTSVNQYAKFASDLLQGKLLKPETMAMLCSNQLTPAQAKTYDWPHHAGYDYGLGVRINAADHPGEYGWGGAAGSKVYLDPNHGVSMFYAHHMLNPQPAYYMPRLKQALYESLR